MRNRVSWPRIRRLSPRAREVSRSRHGDDPPCASAAHPDLRPPIQSLSLRRLLIVAWLIAWMSTVPLFHIHIPDSTDRWSVLQSGGAHTVFTPDLPGEFSRPFSDSSRSLAKRGVNSPELGIALLVEKSKATELTILRTPSHVLNSPLLTSLVLEAPEQHRTLRLSQAVLAPRAPPRIVS